MMQASLGLPARTSHALRPRTATAPAKFVPTTPTSAPFFIINRRRHYRSSAPLHASTDASPTSTTTSSSTTSGAQPVDLPPPQAIPDGKDGSTVPAADAPAADAPAAAAPAADASTAPAAAAEQPPVPPTATAAAANALNENFSGDMLQPSVVNSPYVRAASVVAAVAAVAGSTVLLPNAVGAFLHVTAYALLLGTQLWNTFFVGITMFKNLPRQTFGHVQAKLFPQYFALTTGSNLMALVTLLLAGAATTAPGLRALVALGVSLAGLLANWLYIEPICTGLMFQRYDIENLPEKTDADKDRIAALYKQFGKWHGISSLINLVSFCVVVAHGWFLASLLVMY